MQEQQLQTSILCDTTCPAGWELSVSVRVCVCFSKSKQGNLRGALSFS